ncbi:UDP-N-acetylmuramoyl-tripeptide--D-alanyl-D-alanine ligase [Paenibacillus endophyticus]|uniref:UDP-N-acetylmuramoyl-tripeptide--D-alanyl-D-alanine ligase n=1 Tax=Paenibacillus endophyticus TaxID=1294268 RepID=A0A7W5CA60_9BACL|nr:UDP-N-acetylmuramoyl-tripeptide--D-alanyl-D-alanine ligase [Paenibacillus endophyticus]MBB3152959.1 UDP-N-acetylmuramoyl-tripeptide--D-alanyl-D-alanine ligase [Paenibacillus endophyticus]
MIKRTIKQIAEMSGARWNGIQTDLKIEGVTTDSRQAAAGQLFVPLVGEQFDGHAYLKQAVDNGAVAALWQKGREVPEGLEAVPLLIVGDTLLALQRLATAYRSELFVRVVGITGSNGKTTTKDMTASILGTSYKVRKTEGNLNNHIGLPLTVLQLEEDTEVAVLEMGMSGFGEIELLTKIAQPDAAIITNIGDAHLLHLGSRAGIAKAKLEIALGLSEDGLLLYNGDEPLLEEELERAVLPAGIVRRTFGLSEKNEWSAADIAVESEAATFTAIYQGSPSGLGLVRIPVPGQHNVSNALAAIAIGRFFGVPAAKIADGLRDLKLTGMRIQPVRAFNGAMILNDAYNANPTAVRAAIDLVEQLDGYTRKWIVLGDMLELGPDEQVLHFEAGAYITPSKADAVLTFGPLAVHIAEGARSQFTEADAQEAIKHFASKEELSDWLRDQLQSSDLVLIKGSRGMRMEQIVQALEVG